MLYEVITGAQRRAAARFEGFALAFARKRFAEIRMSHQRELGRFKKYDPLWSEARNLPAELGTNRSACAGIV